MQQSSQSSHRPLHHVAAEYTATLADKVSRFGLLCGISLLPWQLDVLSDWAAVDEDGKFVHPMCGLSVPRQNGKSFVVKLWVLYLAAVKCMRVLWTCHNYSTTVEMVNHVRDIVGERPGDRRRGIREINALLKRASAKTSQESFTFKGGGRIEFSTRTKSSSLGFGFDVVVVDEAQQLTDEQAQAVIPTMNAAPKHNPQAVFIGTPPRAGQIGGEGFTNHRDSALSGETGSVRMCWTEYGVDHIPDPRDESYWPVANPSLGTVAGYTALRIDAQSLQPLAFAQDCLGYWLPKQSLKAAIDAKSWDGCEIGIDEVPSLDGARMAFGVKFSADGSQCAISYAVKGEEGEKPYIELYDVFGADHGTDAFAGWLVAKASEYKACQVGIDGKSGAGALKQKLVELGMKEKAVKVYGPREMQEAASMLVDAVKDGGVRHIASPPLDESAKKSIRRRIGNDGFGFGDGAGCTSAPVESAAIALHSVMTSKRDPRRKAVVW